jgi:hypothetical protein
MTAGLLFSVANLLALASWIAMAILPRWHATPNIIVVAAILLLSMLYLFLIVLFFGQADGGFGTLAQVKRLFANDFAALAGWVHYLAFDLFIGRWMLLDSQRVDLSHWLMLPCLALTFLFGPIGLLMYVILKLILTQQLF